MKTIILIILLSTFNARADFTAVDCPTDDPIGAKYCDLLSDDEGTPIDYFNYFRAQLTDENEFNGVYYYYYMLRSGPKSLSL